jgi:hypothetical protein
MAIEVKVSIPGLARLRKAVLNNPALSRAISGAWSTIYRSYVRQRFAKFSRGGGDWAPLSAATLAGRRKGKGSGNAAILRDTGAMFASLNPSLGSGGLLQSIPRPMGFTAVLGGSQTYKSGPTLTEVASYHHHGDGNLPERVILAQPDRATIANMGEHAHRIMVKFAGNR